MIDYLRNWKDFTIGWLIIILLKSVRKTRERILSSRRNHQLFFFPHPLHNIISLSLSLSTYLQELLFPSLIKSTSISRVIIFRFSLSLNFHSFSLLETGTEMSDEHSFKLFSIQNLSPSSPLERISINHWVIDTNFQTNKETTFFYEKKMDNESHRKIIMKLNWNFMMLYLLHLKNLFFTARHPTDDEQFSILPPTHIFSYSRNISFEPVVLAVT